MNAPVPAPQDDFAQACAVDPEGLIGVLELARQIWAGEELANWLTTPNAMFVGRTPIRMCAEMLADEVLFELELEEIA